MASYSSTVSTVGGRFSYSLSADNLKKRQWSPTALTSPPPLRRGALVVKAEGGHPEIPKNMEKVVDNVLVSELSKPLTAYCRCWRLATFPLCDGSHVKHNKATGDNVGPLLLKK